MLVTAHDTWAEAPAATDPVWDNGSLFTTREWLESWWDAYGESRQLELLSAHDDARRCVGIAPLCLRRQRVGPISLGTSVEFVGSRERPFLDYLGFVCEPAERPAVVHAFLGRIAERSGHWDGVHLTNLDVAETADDIERWARSRDWRVTREPGGTSLRATLPATWDEYLAARSRAVRRRIRWERRKLDDLGATVVWAASGGATPQELLARLTVLNDARAIERRGVAGQLADPAYATFAEGLCERCAPRGWLRLAILTCPDGDLAGLLAFARAGTVHYFLTGRSSLLPQFSCGQVLLSHLVERSIAEGATTLDMLAGDEPYKHHWADRRCSTTTVEVSRPGLGGARLRLFHGLRRARNRRST